MKYLFVSYNGKLEQEVLIKTFGLQPTAAWRSWVSFCGGIPDVGS